MEKAWSQPALQQAKDRYIRATEEFRAAMRTALQEADPEVVNILEKMKPQQGDPRALPKLPPPTDDAFAKVAVERLGLELLSFVRPENRQKIRAVHDKILQTSEVEAAVKRLLEAPPDKRVEALGKLREIYREAITKEIPAIPPRPAQRPASADAGGARGVQDSPPGR